MTRKRLESMVEAGVPFGLRTRDGREFAIPGPESIFLPEAVEYALVFDHAGHLTVLPIQALEAVAPAASAVGVRDLEAIRV